MRNDRKFSEREGLMSSSSKGLNFIDTGELVALFSHQSRLHQDLCSKRDCHEPVFSFSLTQQMLRDLFMKEIEITCFLKRDPN